MAQLTMQEQQKLRATGQWARERCDRTGCANIIGYLAWNGRRGGVFCSRACLVAQGEAGDLPSKRARRGEAKPFEATGASSVAEIRKALLNIFTQHPKRLHVRNDVIREMERAKFGPRPLIRIELRTLEREGILRVEGAALRFRPKMLIKLTNNRGAEPQERLSRENRVNMHTASGKSLKSTHFADAPFEEE